MEREKIIAKWQREIDNEELSVNITVDELYDYADSLKKYMDADEPISHSDIKGWIYEYYWSDSDVELEDYNEWLRNKKYYDDIIYKNTEYEINDYFCNWSPYDIIQKVIDEDYNTRDDYFKPTIYGIESFNDWYEYMDDDFRFDAIDDNLTNDDTIAEIWDNEDEIIEKVEELYAIENAEHILENHNEISKEIEQAKELLNSYELFYDCSVDEESNVYVLLDKDFHDNITDVFTIDKKYDGQTIQDDVSELCRTHDDYNNDMIADMLFEKYGADRRNFWALYY